MNKPKFVSIKPHKYSVYAIDTEGQVWRYCEWVYSERKPDDRCHSHWQKLDQFGPPPERALTIDEQAKKEVEELLA